MNLSLSRRHARPRASSPTLRMPVDETSVAIPSLVPPLLSHFEFHQLMRLFALLTQLNQSREEIIILIKHQNYQL